MDQLVIPKRRLLAYRSSKLKVSLLAALWCIWLMVLVSIWPTKNSNKISTIKVLVISNQIQIVINWIRISSTVSPEVRVKEDHHKAMDVKALAWMSRMSKRFWVDHCIKIYSQLAQVILSIERRRLRMLIRMLNPRVRVLESSQASTTKQQFFNTAKITSFKTSPNFQLSTAKEILAANQATEVSGQQATDHPSIMEITDKSILQISKILLASLAQQLVSLVFRIKWASMSMR